MVGIKISKTKLMKRYFVYDGHGFTNDKFLNSFEDWYEVKKYVKENLKLTDISVIDWDESLTVKTDRNLLNLQWRYDSNL